MEKYKYKFFWFLLPIVRACVFLFLLYSATKFGGSFEQMSLRNVDDNAMQTSIFNMQDAILNLNFQNIFYKYDYAYGWLFWAIYSTTTLPLFFLLKIFPENGILESVYIIGNRLITVAILIILVSVLLKFKKILPETRRHIRGIKSELLLTSFLFLPTVGYWSGRVQPTLLTGLLTMASFRYLLLSITREEDGSIFGLKVRDKNIVNSIIFISAAIGVKPTVLGVMPFYIFALNMILNLRSASIKKSKIRTMSKYIVISVVTILVSTSPSFFIKPITTLTHVVASLKFFSNTATRNVEPDQSFIQRMFLGLAKPTFGELALIMIFIFISGVGISQLPNAIKYRDKFFLIVLFVFPIIFFTSLVTADLSLLSVYLFPTICLFLALPIYLVDHSNISELIKNLFVYLLVFCILFNFIQNLSSSNEQRQAINSYVVSENTSDVKITITAQQELRRLVGSNFKGVILQSYRSPTIVSDLRQDVTTLYVFDNWSSFIDLEKINYIVLNTNDFALKNIDSREAWIKQDPTRIDILQSGYALVSNLNEKGKFSDFSCNFVHKVAGNFLFKCIQ